MFIAIVIASVVAVIILICLLAAKFIYKQYYVQPEDESSFPSITMAGYPPPGLPHDFPGAPPPPPSYTAYLHSSRDGSLEKTSKGEGGGPRGNFSDELVQLIRHHASGPLAANAETYTTRLVASGFDDWFVIGSLRFADLMALNIPTGHMYDCTVFLP